MKLSLSKSEACVLRKTIRRNILVNSRQALLKRVPLAELEVLMGGVVMERRELIEVARGNGKCRVSCLVPPAELEASVKGEAGEENFRLISLGHATELTIYDFSGAFEISGFVQDREVRKKISGLRVGDVVYVSGKIIPMNNAAGYHLRPKDLYSPDEFLFYREMFSEKFSLRKREIREVLARSYAETVNDRLFYSKSDMDMVRLFCSRPGELKVFDYFWLCGVVYERYRKTLMSRFAKATLKYFLIYGSSQNWDGVDPEEYFFSMHDELRGVVDFPKEY